MLHSLNLRHPRGCHSRIQTWPPHQTGFFVESRIPYGPFSIQNGRSYPLLRKYGCENGHYRIPWESVSENSQMLLRKGAVSYPRQKYRIDEENPVSLYRIRSFPHTPASDKCIDRWQALPKHIDHPYKRIARLY